MLLSSSLTASRVFPTRCKVLRMCSRIMRRITMIDDYGKHAIMRVRPACRIEIVPTQASGFTVRIDENGQGTVGLAMERDKRQSLFTRFMRAARLRRG